ncbi:MAG: SBBP repeat-containing protein [Acidobacteriota bacterium]
MSSWFRAIWRMRASVALVTMMATILWAGGGTSKPEGDKDEDDCCALEEDIVCLLAGALSSGNSASVDFNSSLPLAFEMNLGQVEPGNDYIAQARNGGVVLSGGSASLMLPAEEGAVRVQAEWVGARQHVEAEPEQILPGRTNYFFGQDPDKWLSDVPSFTRVRYRDIYPGIDVVYYGREGELEHDFIVHPGADPSRIRLNLSGAGKVTVNADGDAVFQFHGRDLRWRKPVVYQQLGKRRRQVESRYKVDNGTLAFELGRFDPDRPLVIDPVVSFATYFGKAKSEAAGRVAVDSQGNVYTVGASFDPNFPVSTGAYRSFPSQTGYHNVVIMKVNATGTASSFTTYIGGGFADVGGGIALDTAGNIYVTGGTNSTDFPVSAGALKSRFNPVGLLQPDRKDCFVTKLASGGGALSYSTYLGGTSQDGCTGIAVDQQGNAYLSGYTESSQDFPTTAGAPQRFGVGRQDAFIAKLNPTGTALVYSTQLGGQDTDAALGIAIDAQGAAYVTGQTTSANNFPVTDGSAQTTYGGRATTSIVRYGDAFVTKLNPAGTAFVYSTFLGGSGDEIGFGIAVDGPGNAYVVGSTLSANYPTTSGAYKTTYSGTGRHPYMPAGDVFVTKLNPTGTQRVYSTYLGGASDDWGMAIAVDPGGNAWVTGATMSADFPVTTDATQRTYGGHQVTGDQFFTGDIFVTQLSSNGGALVFSTYQGGTGNEAALGIAIDPSGGVVISGTSRSTDMPTTTGALQTKYGGDNTNFLPAGDIFLAKFGGTGGGGGILSVAAIVSAASYAGGGVAPGEIVVLTGGGIGPQQLTTLELTPQGTVSTLLNGTRVLFDNVAAPVIYASSGQTSVIVPYEVANKQSTQMVVEYSGGRSAALTVPVLQSKPALFSANASGRGQGAILNADNSYNSASIPIAKGGVVQLFGTGEGPIDPPGVTGRLSSSVVPRILLPTQVTIGGQNARVLYAGAAPGAVGGLFQINAEVPAGAASGPQEVIVTIGNTRSQTGLTVAVQ